MFYFQFDLACQEGKRSLVGTMHNIGMLISMPIMGFVSDKYVLSLSKHMLVLVSCAGGVSNVCVWAGGAGARRWSWAAAARACWASASPSSTPTPPTWSPKCSRPCSGLASTLLPSYSVSLWKIFCKTGWKLPPVNLAEYVALVFPSLRSDFLLKHYPKL